MRQDVSQNAKLVNQHAKRDSGPAPGIVISGAALISCLGIDRESTWQRVLRGECGMVPMTALEMPLSPLPEGGQAVDLPVTDGAGSDIDEPRASRYLRLAIADALKDASLSLSADESNPYPPGRCGFMLGTTLHGMRSGGQFFRSGDYQHLGHFLSAATMRDATRGLDSASGIQGLAATTCSACSSSLGSVALAVTLLQSREFDVILAGGYDTISEYAYAGFNSLRLVAGGPLRPFARQRQGMKLAEGYGIIVLEREADARRRGARIIARVLGCGESADAHHLTQPHPAGDGAARAMREAMDRASVTSNEIGLIAAHATGTPDNDAGEYAALSRVFGEHLPRVPVVAFKSHLGHTLGGAGAVELILSAMAMRDQIVPPCAGITPEDLEFPALNLVTGSPRKHSFRATLNTSLGFGGANTCVVLGHPDDAADLSAAPVKHVVPSIARTDRQEVFITGIGIVLPNSIGNDAFVRMMNDASRKPIVRDAGPIPEDQIVHLLNSRRVRRISDYAKLSLAATALALKDAGITDVPAFSTECSAIAGSNHCSTQYCESYYSVLVRDGLIGANPMLFAEGVPNAAAAHLSLMLSLKGACQTIIDSRTAALDALRLASLRIAGGQWNRAIVSAAEEFSPVINAAYRHCGLYAGPESDSAPAASAFSPASGFFAGAGAVTFVLESRSSMESRHASSRGKVEAAAAAAGLHGGDNANFSAGRRVIAELGSPQFIIASANGTWIDRFEAAILSGASPTVTSIYGHIAECFSVGPLAGIAAVLLSGRLPRLLNETPSIPGFDRNHLRAARGDERPGSFGVLASDYTGLLAGVRISCAANEAN